MRIFHGYVSLLEGMALFFGLFLCSLLPFADLSAAASLIPPFFFGLYHAQFLKWPWLRILWCHIAVLIYTIFNRLINEGTLW
jgi:hypothetical protein